MRRTWFLLLMLFILSCTKKEVRDIQTDSFRISILPVVNPAFNQYRLNGTLEVRQAAGSIEYGLVVGRSLNPTVEHDQVLKVGDVSATVDFNHIITGLDTGFVYYVRAYGKSGTATQYSANQTIGQLSPRLSLNSMALQYGQTFDIFTNFSITASDALPEVRLNDAFVKLAGEVGSGDHIASISIIPPATLQAGLYTLTVRIGGLTLTYPGKLTLLEGTWSRLDLLPRDYSSFSIPDRYVLGDWIYTSQLAANFTPLFSRYNYKTGENQNLTPLSTQQLTQGAAIIQTGNDLHFLGGELIATGSPNRPVTSTHMVYHTTANTWTQEADIPAPGRRNAALMIVGNHLYYGLGTDPSITVGGYFSGLTDFWDYDLTTKTWDKLKDFPGSGRFSRASFSVDGKLFVTGGNGERGAPVRETWCYDPAAKQWIRKADYPGQGWINLLTFSTGGYGFAGLGETASYDSYYGRNIFPNLYKYDSAADKWAEVSNFGGNLTQPFAGDTGSGVLVGAGLDADSTPSRALWLFKLTK